MSLVFCIEVEDPIFILKTERYLGHSGVMGLRPFHPIIQEWFQTHLGDPTEPQLQAWPLIQGGHSVLVAAPTGSGKTLTAFLSAIDGLLKQGSDLSDQTQVLYVSPLKALSHDIEKNLQLPLKQIEQMDPFLPKVRVMVRTGDTPASQRQAMTKKPPHIVVTTPESLYLLLTSRGGRKVLKTVKTVIIDEVHALMGDKRGAHLGLSLERLAHLCGEFQRIGLSATQKSMVQVKDFLMGGERACQLVEIGHQRQRDLAIEIPESPLQAICSHQTWGEIYDRIVELVSQHQSTLIFVNTRKLAERLAARLSDRLSDELVSCHHGSLSRDHRLKVEQYLKAGKLKALVATASLELGIDIGDVDLTIQIGSCRSIATFLQRVGRSGHHKTKTPKGRLFPLTLDELVESTALLRAIRQDLLDALPIPQKPFDILAQQIVASCINEDWTSADLYALFKRCDSYRDLTFDEFLKSLNLHTQGRYALLHYDRVTQKIRATKRARLSAILSGGAIPDTADFRVQLEPEGTYLGTVNEDFAIESNVGDIFQLGNMSWRILKVDSKKAILHVADAKGLPPSLPFWFGEAPARSWELSEQVGLVREEATSIKRVVDTCGVSPEVAQIVVDYQQQAKTVLKTVPTTKRVIVERFFDDTGGMQMVIHSPFGSRINRAWGLALRKRICTGFGFELEAAANEDTILISLAPHTSFRLEEIFKFLSPKTLEYLLTQAILTGGQFETRWRWNVTRSLVVAKHQGGKKLPAYLVRLKANDALAAAFPQVLACPETLDPGPIEVPTDHVLVKQTLIDCFTELLDLEGLTKVLTAITRQQMDVMVLETSEPSVLAQSILNAQPYAFLDDVPAEERRTRAVFRKPSQVVQSHDPQENLDADLIARIQKQIWPQPETKEELHECLSWMGYVTSDEVARSGWQHWMDELRSENRVKCHQDHWSVCGKELDEISILKGRLEALGIVPEGSAKMLELESQGLAIQVCYLSQPHWCHRRVLARYQAQRLEGLRRPFRPVSIADFLKFLTTWQHIGTSYQTSGPQGVAQVLDQLAGFEAPFSFWEKSILPLRVNDYRPEWLDELLMTGQYAWVRLWGSSQAALKTLPITFVKREHLHLWLSLKNSDGRKLSGRAKPLFDLLNQKGALFSSEILKQIEGLEDHFNMGLTELIGLGLVTNDSFHALRRLYHNVKKQKSGASHLMGRWSIVPSVEKSDGAVQLYAWALLKRHGVVFKKILEREKAKIYWRDLLSIYQRLEMQGKIRGGRFVDYFSGEQFALPEACEQLKAFDAHNVSAIDLSAADPLNFQGILTPDAKVSPRTHQKIKLFG